MNLLSPGLPLNKGDLFRTMVIVIGPVILRDVV